jgi:hypothetical protein
MHSIWNNPQGTRVTAHPGGAASFRIPVPGLATGVTEVNASLPACDGWGL